LNGIKFSLVKDAHFMRMKTSEERFCVCAESGSVQPGHHLVRDVLQTHDHRVRTHICAQPTQESESRQTLRL